MTRKNTPMPAAIEKLFIGVYPAGLVYSDRSETKNGDYKRCAFLPYKSLELQVAADCTPELLPIIQADAADMQSKRGQRYRISTSGQFVILGE